MLAVIVGAAWLYLPGGEPAGREAGASSDAASVSDVLEKIRSVLDGESEEVSLDAGEIEALLAGPLEEHLPDGVSPPRVVLERGTVLTTLPVPFESALPLPDVAVAAGVIPDTLRATVRALVASDDGSFSVHVERLTFAGVPIPRFLAASIARRLGIGGVGEVSTTSADEAMSWPLPSGIEAVYIDGDRLVLRGDR